MIKNKRLILKIVLILMISCGYISISFAQSIFEGADGPKDPCFQLVEIYGNNLSFSAKAIVNIIEEDSEDSKPLEIFYDVLEGKIRSVFDITQMSPGCSDMFKQSGIDLIWTVFILQNKNIFVIYPRLKSYYEVLYDKDKQEEKEFSISKIKIDKETINKHPCNKYKIVISTSNKKSKEIISWEAIDLKDFPIKIKYESEYNYVLRTKKALITVYFENINFNKPSDSLFEIPKDYKRYNNRSELISSITNGLFPSNP
jgi:hypothetical protein